MYKLAIAVLFCLLLTASASATNCTTVAEPEPTKAPNQKYLYVHVSGLVQLLTRDDVTGTAWLLLPNATNPVDYELKGHVSVFSEEHQGRIFLKTGTETTSELVKIFRCGSPVDNSASLQGRSLDGWSIVLTSDTASTLTLDGSLTDLADLDYFVKAVTDFDPSSELEVTPSDLNTTATGDLLGRVELNGGVLYVSKRWECGGSDMFDLMRWGNLSGSSINGTPVSGSARRLAAVLTARIPIQSSANLVMTPLSGSASPTTITVGPDGDRIELIVENDPPSGKCGLYGLHFAGHYFLSGKLDSTEHIVVPRPYSVIGGSGDDAMCSPSWSDGKP